MLGPRKWKVAIEKRGALVESTGREMYARERYAKEGMLDWLW